VRYGALDGDRTRHLLLDGQSIPSGVPAQSAGDPRARGRSVMVVRRGGFAPPQQKDPTKSSISRGPP